MEVFCLCSFSFFGSRNTLLTTCFRFRFDDDFIPFTCPVQQRNFNQPAISFHSIPFRRIDFVKRPQFHTTNKCFTRNLSPSCRMSFISYSVKETLLFDIYFFNSLVYYFSNSLLCWKGAKYCEFRRRKKKCQHELKLQPQP